MIKKNKIIYILITSTCFLIVSCTDLSEKINNEVPASRFFQNEEEFISALGDAYGPFAGSASTGFFPAGYGGAFGITALHEVTTDEIVVPQRGADWEDGGRWIRLHRHSFNRDEQSINESWITYFTGVNNVNRLIFQFENVLQDGNADPELAEIFISELRAVRAFYYLLLIDNFGNVPIVSSFDNAPEDPSQPSSDFQEGRIAVFEFIESELLDIVDKVDTRISSTIGRINKWVVHTLLTRLYLNAEVYTKIPRWEDAIFHADQVINSDNYSLLDNYANIFRIENTGASEHIFTIPYDEVFLPGFNLIHSTHHIGGGQDAFNLGSSPWGGYSAVSEFYASYIDSEQNPGPQGPVIGLDPLGTETVGTVDDRLINFFTGPLIDQQGNQVRDQAVEEFDPDGAPITYTPHINTLAPDGLRQAGARIHKYEVEIGLSGSNMNNDFVVMRYAEILLSKAEALWRLNPGSGEALVLVNEIRRRAGVDPFESLDADKILAERGREHFFEHLRRTDLIRFAGKEGETRFNDSWWEKDVSPSFVNVFPIPTDQLEANSNLVQNPGFN